MSFRPARHDLLRVTPGGWAALFAREPVLAGLDGMRNWRVRGLPVMARRPQPGDDPDALPVCVALPPDHGRLRLPFCLPPEAVDAILPPVRPDDVLGSPSLPASWRDRLLSVRALAGRMALQPSLFGSLMWQHVTGLSFLRDGSDLDLLWRFGVGERCRIEVLLSALSALDALPGPRLDGEILVDGRGAVSWRELALGRDGLLLRTDRVVRLVSRDRFLDRAPVSC